MESEDNFEKETRKTAPEIEWSAFGIGGKREKSTMDYEKAKGAVLIDTSSFDEEPDDTPLQPFLYHSYRILDLCNAIKRLVEFPENKKVYIKVSKYAEEIVEIADMVGFVDE